MMKKNLNHYIAKHYLIISRLRSENVKLKISSPLRAFSKRVIQNKTFGKDGRPYISENICIHVSRVLKYLAHHSYFYTYQRPSDK